MTRRWVRLSEIAAIAIIAFCGGYAVFLVCTEPMGANASHVSPVEVRGER